MQDEFWYNIASDKLKSLNIRVNPVGKRCIA